AHARQDKEVASISFHEDGSPSYISCTEDPAIAKLPFFNKTCGFTGKAGKITMYYAKGKKRNLQQFDKGKLIAIKTFDENGKVTSSETKATDKKVGVEI